MKKLIIGVMFTTTLIIASVFTVSFNNQPQDITPVASNDEKSEEKTSRDTPTANKVEEKEIAVVDDVAKQSNVVKTNSTIVNFADEQDLATVQSQYENYQVEQLYPDSNKKYVISAASVEDYQALTEQLNTDENINNFENNITINPSATATPNDNYFNAVTNSTTSYKTYQGSMQQSKVDLAWNTTTGNGNAIIAVIDTGSSIGQHKDLEASLAWVNSDEIPNNKIDDDANGYVDDYNGYNFTYEGIGTDLRDTTGHGSHVTSTIGESTNNTIGGAGINQNAQIMSLKVFPKGQGASLSSILQAEKYAINNGAKIVNMSLGGYYFSTEEYALIKNNPNVLFVAAAGNDGSSTIAHPAGYSTNYTYNGSNYPGLSNVIAVAAANPLYQRSSYSNYGNWIDVAAPGNNVFNSRCYWNSADSYTSDVTNNDLRWKCTYSMLNGTSMATPTVSAVASLIYSVNPNLTAYQVKSIITSVASHPTTLNNTVKNNNFINAEAAVLKAQELTNVNLDSITFSNSIVDSTVANNILTVTFDGKIYQEDQILQNFSRAPKVELINKNTNAVVAKLTPVMLDNQTFTASINLNIVPLNNVHQLRITPNEDTYFGINNSKVITQAPAKNEFPDLKTISKIYQDGTFQKQKTTFRNASAFNNITKQLKSKFYIADDKTTTVNTYNVDFSLSLIRNEDNQVVSLTGMPTIQLVSTDLKSTITINPKNVYKTSNANQYVVKIPETYLVNGKTYNLKYKISETESVYQNLSLTQKNYTNLSTNKAATTYNFKDGKKVQSIPYKLTTQLKVSYM